MNKPNILVKTPLGLENIAAARILELNSNVKVYPRPQGFLGLVLVEADKHFEFARKIKENVLEAEKVIPAYEVVEADLNKIVEAARKVALGNISSEETFAVRTTRRGKHDFTSLDVNVKAGAAVKEVTNASVNLSFPDKIVDVEIIGDIEVEVKHSAVGVIVEAEVEGKYDDEVIIGVHHDHWFKGVGDNLASIALIISLVKQLVNPKYTIKIVSFTAEESGAPGFSPWYWAYGSRRYLEILGENKLDKIKLAIILDTITKTPLTISSIDLEVEELCEEIVGQHRGHTIIDYLTPDTDAVSFALKGIPTICIHAIPDFLPIYHTQQDDIEEIEPEALKTTAKILKTIIKEADKYLDKPEKYLKKLCKRLKIKAKAHRKAYEDKKNFRRRKREINKITYILYTEQYIEGVEKDERFHFTRGIEGRITQRLNEIEEIISLVEKGKINIAREKLEKIPVEIKIPGYETPIFTLNINQILELLCKNRKKTCISILSETLNIYKTLTERISQKTKRNLERVISSEEPPKASYMDILY